MIQCPVSRKPGVRKRAYKCFYIKLKTHRLAKRTIPRNRKKEIVTETTSGWENKIYNLIPDREKIQANLILKMIPNQEPTIFFKNDEINRTTKGTEIKKSS